MRGYGTRLVWNSVKSTFRAPSNRKEAEKKRPKLQKVSKPEQTSCACVLYCAQVVWTLLLILVHALCQDLFLLRHSNSTTSTGKYMD